MQEKKSEILAKILKKPKQAIQARAGGQAMTIFNLFQVDSKDKLIIIPWHDFPRSII
jgi:hypothetical protein